MPEGGCLQRTGGLGHLLRVEQQVAVGAHRARPLVGLPRPDRGVVVQREGQVVVDQVLAGHLNAPPTSHKANIPHMLTQDTLLRYGGAAALHKQLGA